MRDHAKPTVGDFDPHHIILNFGTNDLNSDRTSSQITRETIDLAPSLKSDKNKISISVLTLRRDKLRVNFIRSKHVVNLGLRVDFRSF